MRKLHRVSYEENRCVIPDHIVVTIAGVEFEGKAAYIPPGVGTAAFTGYRGKPGQHFGLRARLEHAGLVLSTDILGYLEMTENSRALSIRLAVRDHLAVEIGHLLEQIMIL